MPGPLSPLQPLLPAIAPVQPVQPAWPAEAVPEAPAPALPPPVPPPAAAFPPVASTVAGAAPRARRREDTLRFWALVPCAGSGSRAMAGDVQPGGPAKQYRAVAGKPLVLHTLAAFAGTGRVAGTLVVVAPGDDFLATHALPAGVQIADCGGSTRALSVSHGLAALLARGAAPQDWVLVHDAARCLVTPQQVDALIDACRTDAVGGLLAQPLADTLKRAEAGRVAETVDRGDKWLAQTPQMFRIALLADALQHAGALVTDEAAAVEALGHAPRLVPAGGPNFKVTWPEDFALAEAVLLGRRASGATVERYQGRRDDIPLTRHPRMY